MTEEREMDRACDYARGDDPDACGVCGGPVVVLGTLGDREHVRCRDCGAEASRESAEAFCERMDEDEDEQADRDEAYGLEGV